MHVGQLVRYIQSFEDSERGTVGVIGGRSQAPGSSHLWCILGDYKGDGSWGWLQNNVPVSVFEVIDDIGPAGSTSTRQVGKLISHRDENGFLIPICHNCLVNIHSHLDYLHDSDEFMRLMSIEVHDKGKMPYQVLRVMSDCKVTDEDNREQCCCRVGRP